MVVRGCGLDVVEFCGDYGVDGCGVAEVNDVVRSKACEEVDKKIKVGGVKMGGCVDNEWKG